MKRFFQWGILSVIICLLLIGAVSCKKVTEGRYVERDVTPETEEDIIAVFREDDTLFAYTEGLKSVYTSTDKGDSWERKDGPGTAYPDIGEIQEITRTPGGTLIFQHGDRDSSIVKITPEGEWMDQLVSAFDEDRSNNENVRLWGLEAVSETDLVVYYDIPEYYEYEEGEDIVETIYTEGNADFEEYLAVYDMESGAKQYDLNPYSAEGSVACSGDIMYVMTIIDNLNAFKIENGEQVLELTGFTDLDDRDSSVSHIAVAGAEDNLIYAADSRQIRSINTEKGTTETVVDSANYRFGSPLAVQTGLFCFGAEEFLIPLEDQDGISLYRYQYDEAVEIDEKNQLQVWTLEENATVRAAIREYMTRYPDATVELEVAMESGNMTQNDALRDLNTRLLAGEGPDIMLLDDTPMNTYVQNELLLDLSSEVSLDGLFQSVREAYEREEGVYYIPARFAMPLVIWNEESPEVPADMEAFITAMLADDSRQTMPEDTGTGLPAEERYMVRIYHVKLLSELLWKSSQPEILSDGTVDSGQLRYFLEQVKSVTDHYDHMVYGGDTKSSGLITQNRYCLVEDSACRFLAKHTHYGVDIAGDLNILSMLSSDGAEYASFIGMTEGSWLPFCFTGVNAETKNKEYAVEFAEIMLGDSVQGTITDGIPVTMAGAVLQMESVEDELITEAVDVDALVSEMKTPVEVDRAVYEMVYTGVEKLVQGELELEAAVSQIEGDIQRYYAEKQ